MHTAFKGFKDWGVFPYACEEIALSGFAVIAINFSRNGIGNDKEEFGRLDLFAGQTLSSNLDDIGSVIRALQKKEIDTHHAHLNTDSIGIIGHSRGGHTAITAAVEYESVQCLVTWSAVADCNTRWTKEMLSDWKKNGFTEIKNARTGQMMRMDKVIYEDAIENARRVIAANRINELRIPSLFIHARDDEAVSYTDSEQLHIKCDADSKELRLVSRGGHTFGTSHPFEGDEFPEPFEEIMNWTIGWFKENLR